MTMLGAILGAMLDPINIGIAILFAMMAAHRGAALGLACLGGVLAALLYVALGGPSGEIMAGTAIAVLFLSLIAFEVRTLLNKYINKAQ